MKVLLFGATGMVGQGVLRECLLDPDIEQVVAIVRSTTGRQHPKLIETICPDLSKVDAYRDILGGHDACFYCLGISSAGLSEAEYSLNTYDLTRQILSPVADRNPNITIVYLSGSGADSTEQGKVMWARVKGRIENALSKLPVKAVYSFRPAYIQPLHGIVSRTKLYRLLYSMGGWLYPLLKRVMPKYITTTEQVGKAMITVAKRGFPTSIVENWDINPLAR